MRRKALRLAPESTTATHLRFERHGVLARGFDGFLGVLQIDVHACLWMFDAAAAPI